MECPACRESMAVIEYKSIELDYCVGCMGVWFDRSEIELLLEIAGIPVPPGAFAFTWTGGKTPDTARRCPLCRKSMRAVSVTGSAVVLDQCPGLEGVWFDAGEIYETIRDIAGGDSAIIPDVLRRFLGEAIGTRLTNIGH
ncbi:MAG TPA: zf-TFIIB domain-containing protein [Acidobacteriota bacterium]|nr:zf-TFIIB domain-containing protein [Acidobacteriota bacterium]